MVTDSGVPAVPLPGERITNFDAAGLIVNVCEPDVPPPGVGLTTVTAAVPVAATSDDSIEAVSWVEEIKVVAFGDPFQLTVELGANPVPPSVSVNPVLPAAVEVGVMELRAGLGLFIVKLAGTKVAIV